ncbi:hypothetical protein [Streptomyces sp. G1]|uniref:hypothetical protein n=1 Tax=Streptomyces sp. G1 TaxID=361572 RepID=UPI00202ED3A8|nr:hypothetical protein [Streptomyces sp. G1]MCM1973021.1 hypothetical protein [Streptomyces sp. G1]
MKDDKPWISRSDHTYVCSLLVFWMKRYEMTSGWYQEAAAEAKKNGESLLRRTQYRDPGTGRLELRRILEDKDVATLAPGLDQEFEDAKALAKQRAKFRSPHQRVCSGGLPTLGNRR